MEVFLTNGDKLHKNSYVFIGNFALVLHFRIGYNVVTKVTAVAFGCHNCGFSCHNFDTTRNKKECRQ